MGLQGHHKLSLLFRKVQRFLVGVLFDAYSEQSKAFNMGNDVAISVVYGNFVFNGNLITDLMSIGQKTSRTGVDPGPPCEVGGLSDHNTFEGAFAT
jgi:hypothetical protein